MKSKVVRVHVDPGFLQRMSDARMSRPEMARVLKVSEGVLARRMKAHGVSSFGEEVRREREWLQAGRHVIRDPFMSGGRLLAAWTDPARNWGGPRMRPEYLEAMLEHGLLERIETVGNVRTEHYRYAKVAKDPDGGGE